jgi:squalene-associated FAD-dependent desaturase
MPSVIVAGGGLAGLAAAAALGQSGYDVTLLESRPFLGGRATSYPAPGDDPNEIIDNCQHVLLRCCGNLMDFYARLGVAGMVRFYREFNFIEPGGRVSVMRRGVFPAPLHFTESFAALTFLSLRDKLAIGRALLALRSEYGRRADLDRITMLDWLQEKRQTPPAIERFWRQILVSAINEELDRMAALHGFQVFRLGFLGRPDSYEMGIPAVPLGDLYSESVWRALPEVKLRLRTPVSRILFNGMRVRGLDLDGETVTADHYVSALPFERLVQVAPELNLPLGEFEHSPITGIHLWFDRKVTDLPHATLLDRTIQWFFNKQEGRYLQLVVSASRSLTQMPKQEVINLALDELREFLPATAAAKLVKAHVVKEVRATFSARPGLESSRPAARTAYANLALAGDWTRSGWPATMEGAVRSGYLAAECVSGKKFLIPDIA